MGYVQHFTLFNHYLFIRMLVIVTTCPRKWSEDFLTLSNDFQAFKVKLFSKNSLCSSILNHLQTKVTLKNPNSCIFFFFFTIYNPKVVTVLTNLIFLVLGLQMIKNSLMQPLTILFCILAQPLWMSLFLKFFFILKNFLSSNNPPATVSSCQISSLLDMYFK